MEALVNEYYAQFVSNVVKGRGKGMTAETVRNDWKAYVYSASEALALGMIDRIATLDETIARILSASPDAEDQRAAQAILSPIDATDQELPARAATSQERLSELALQHAVLGLTL